MTRRFRSPLLPARAPDGRRTGQAARATRGRVAPPNPNDVRRRVALDDRDPMRGPLELADPRATKPRPRAPQSTRVAATRLVVVDAQLVRAKRDRSRIAIMATLIIALLCGVVARLVNVQIVQGDRWRQEAKDQSAKRTETLAPRGTIFDRNGNPLADDVPSDRVVVNPTKVDNARYYAHVLTGVLGMDEERLYELMQPVRRSDGTQLQYRVLADSVDVNTAAAIRDMEFSGIWAEPQPRRDYPADSLAASLIGAVQPSASGSEGKAGVEFMFDQELKGRPGVVIADRDAKGLAIPRSEELNSPTVAGLDVMMTIDTGIQYQTEQILFDQVLAQQARGGSVTVMDLTDGDVLAMASVTGGLSRSGPHLSTASQGSQAAVMGYEPGSVMKIVTIASALESKCITEDSEFLVPQSMKNGSYTITDDESHGTETWRPIDILTHSSNVGTAMIARQCTNDSPQEFDAWLRKFGFGKPTGLKYPGEATGLLVDPKDYGDSGIGSNAIGYGAVVSPLQVLDSYAAIARGGRFVHPRVVRETVDATGNRSAQRIKEGSTIVSEQTSAALRTMFASVVTEGTGVCAAVPGFEVAGKTGTVRKRNAANGSHYASFVGFAPARSPRIAVMVVLDDPAETYGGKAAAPVFSEVMSVSLARMQVAPESSAPGVQSQFETAHGHARRQGKNCSVPHGETLRNLVKLRNEPPTTTTTPTKTKPKTTPTTKPASSANDGNGPASTSSIGTVTTGTSAPKSNKSSSSASSTSTSGAGRRPSGGSPSTTRP